MGMYRAGDHGPHATCADRNGSGTAQRGLRDPGVGMEQAWRCSSHLFLFFVCPLFDSSLTLLQKSVLTVVVAAAAAAAVVRVVVKVVFCSLL